MWIGGAGVDPFVDADIDAGAANVDSGRAARRHLYNRRPRKRYLCN
jgi:hypothetical protein